MENIHKELREHTGETRLGLGFEVVNNQQIHFSNITTWNVTEALLKHLNNLPLNIIIIIFFFIIITIMISHSSTFQWLPKTLAKFINSLSSIPQVNCSD